MSLQSGFARDFELHGAVSFDPVLWFRCPEFVSYESKPGKKKKEFTFLSWSAIHPGPIFFGLIIRISKNKHTGQALCGKKIWTQNSDPVISATLESF